MHSYVSAVPVLHCCDSERYFLAALVARQNFHEASYDCLSGQAMQIYCKIQLKFRGRDSTGGTWLPAHLNEQGPDIYLIPLSAMYALSNHTFLILSHTLCVLNHTFLCYITKKNYVTEGLVKVLYNQHA